MRNVFFTIAIILTVVLSVTFTGFSVCWSRSYNVISGHERAGITVDIKHGTINNVDITSFTGKDIVRLMGKNPDDKDYNVYSYYDEGIEFTVSKTMKKCYAMSVFFEPMKIMKWSYMPFKYNVVPSIRGKNKSVIIDEFGVPKDLNIISDGSLRIRYETSYGTLYVYFNKVGLVNEVDLILEQPDPPKKE